MYKKKAIRHYEEGRLLQQSNKLSTAERAYKKVIRIQPDFFEAYNNLGNVLVDRKRFTEAINAYRKSLKLAPDHAMLMSNLGNALQLQGENQKAIQWFRKALAANPDYADAYSNLGNALKELDDLEEARESYNKAIKIDPANKEAYNGLANVQLQQDEVDQAIASFRKVLELDPLHKEALTGLGNAFSNHGELDQAIACYRKAIELDSSHKAARLGLGKALIEHGQTEESLAVLNQLIVLDPMDVNAYIQLGKAHSGQGDLDRAIGSYQKAIKLDPQNGYAYQMLGSALSDFGEIERANAVFRQAIQFTPESPGLYRSLAKSKKFSEYDDDIQAMESIYEQRELVQDQKMHLAFGLGKAYEDLKQYKKAMAFYIEANRLKWSDNAFSIVQQQGIFSNLKKTFSSDLFAENKIVGNPDPTPVFILGMIRSGTSLTEQILASHRDVFGAGELSDIATIASNLCPTSSSTELLGCLPQLENSTLLEAAHNYISAIRKYSAEAKHITDKMPQNFVFIGLIKLILPNAKIIHCSRDPMDNCLSIFKNYFSAGQDYSYDMSALGSYYRLYQDLMDHWEDVLPGFIYHSQYEDLVADQENETRKLLNFCDLAWDDNCLNFHQTSRMVKTASNAQVRQPIYKDSIKLWKRYGEQLKPLERAVYGD